MYIQEQLNELNEEERIRRVESLQRILTKFYADVGTAMSETEVFFYSSLEKEIKELNNTNTETKRRKK